MSFVILFRTTVRSFFRLAIILVVILPPSSGLPDLIYFPPSYRYTRGEFEYDEVQPDTVDAQCSNSSECLSERSILDLPLLRKSWIDSDYTDETLSPKVVNGVKMGEGDGTVSLLSLGSMCVEGWKRKRWNPSGIKVVTVEVFHNIKVLWNCFLIILGSFLIVPSRLSLEAEVLQRIMSTS